MFGASYFGISYFGNSFFGDTPAPPPTPVPGPTSAGMRFNTGEQALNASGAFISKFSLRLSNLEVINTSGASAYIQMFDQVNPSSVNLGTTTPDYQFIIANNTSLQRNFSTGLPLKNGLIIYATTTVGGAVGSNAGVKGYGTAG